MTSKPEQQKSSQPLASAPEQARTKAVAVSNKDRYLSICKSEKMMSQMAKSVSLNADEKFIERVVTLVVNAAMKKPDLYDSTQESIMRVLLDCATYGIEPNGRDAHVIPYKTKDGKIEAQLMIDYKGMVTLATKSERVSTVHGEVVCENDIFTWNNGVINHEINVFKPRGAIVAAYAIANMRDGAMLSEVMQVDEIEKVRARSRAAFKGPWLTDYGEMAKKTAVRRLSKYLPLSPAAVKVMEFDDKNSYDLSKPQQPLASTARQKKVTEECVEELLGIRRQTTPQTPDTPSGDIIDADTEVVD